MKHLVLGLLVGAGLLLLDGATANHAFADLTAPSLAAAAVTGVASYGLEATRRQPSSAPSHSPKAWRRSPITAHVKSRSK
jgi:hypothetical protein